jgi:serine/threonine protein kinase
MQEDSLALPNGTRLAEFEIIGRIGEGGFSIVYLAMDHSLQRTVAMKEYMPSSLAVRTGRSQVQPRSHRHQDTFETGLRSFVNEARLLAQFDHPALVKVFRFWEINGTAYTVMPYYQGPTLKEAVQSGRVPRSEEWLVSLLSPLTEALMVIHAAQCYHRDIAPDNILLLDGSSKPLILDFGAARRVIGDMTQALTVILKPGYAPVEQYAEVPGMRQGPWTDVYALAAVVYWVVTGATPPASVGRMLNDTFVPAAKRAEGRYSARFLAAIDRALALRPEHRTPSIQEFRNDLGLGTPRADDGPRPAPAADADATVILPAPPRPEPTAPRERPEVVAAPAQTAPRTAGNTTTVDPVPASAAQAPANDRAAATPPIARRPRWHWGALPIVAAAAAAGLWWARAPSTPEPQPEAPVVNQGAPTLAPSEGAVRESSAGTPAVPRPVPDQEIAPPAPAAAPTVPAPAPPESRTTPRVEPAAAAPKKAATVNAGQGTAAAPPVPRRDSSPAQAAPANVSNRAECERILQRMSLGESNGELAERLKSLNCR